MEVYAANTSDFIRWISLIMHAFGVALGAGGAFMSDGILFTAMRNHVISKSEYKFIVLGGRITLMGILLLIVSGVGIVWSDPRYLIAEKFQAKMIAVVIVTINGVLLHRKAIPLIYTHLMRYLPLDAAFMKLSPWLFVSGAVSFTSWTYTVSLGAARGLKAPLVLLVCLYVLALVVAIICSQMVRRLLLIPKSNRLGGTVMPEGDYTPLDLHK